MKSIILVFLFSVVSASKQKTCSRVVTFNAALSPDVANLNTRRQGIISALEELDPDIICLQEIWEEKDVLNIIDKLGGKYPFSCSGLHCLPGILKCPGGKNDTQKCSQPPACSSNDARHFIDKIIPCAEQHKCVLHKSAVAAVICIMKKCKSTLMNESFSPDCISCFMLTSPPGEATLFSCLRDTQLNRNGLLLLSKKRLYYSSYESFFPDRRMMVPRGYIRTYHWETGWFGCTQLSTTHFPYMEYDLDYGSYAKQQKAEVDTLREKFSSSNVFLLGGFNVGPKIVNQYREQNLTGESTDIYKKLINVEFTAPYLIEDGRCTLCASNQLANGSNNVLDQVLLKGTLVSYTSAKRVLDKTPLSDHYGVEVTVCLEK